MKEIVKLKMNPCDINAFNRLMEGYEYLGAVTTLDRETGIVIVRSTPDFYGEVVDIVRNMPLSCIFLEPDEESVK